MTLRVSVSFIRQSVIIGVVLCLLVTCYSLLRYPGILLPPRVGIVYASILFIVLSSYIVIVLRLTRGTDSDEAWIANLGLTWGIMIAGFWLIEIIAGNLLNPKYSLVQIIYFGSSAIAFSLPFFAGIWGASQSGLIRTGTMIGLWIGIVSGLLTFLSLMAVTYLFLNHMLQDPQNMLQFQQSSAPDLVTFVMGDSLAGATGHLVIGLILCPGLGTIGGIIGRILSNGKPKQAAT